MKAIAEIEPGMRRGPMHVHSMGEFIAELINSCVAAKYYSYRLAT